MKFVPMLHSQCFNQFVFNISILSVNLNPEKESTLILIGSESSQSFVTNDINFFERLLLFMNKSYQSEQKCWNCSNKIKTWIYQNRLLNAMLFIGVRRSHSKSEVSDVTRGVPKDTPQVSDTCEEWTVQ